MTSFAADAFIQQTFGSYAVGRMTHDSFTGSRSS